MAQTTNVNSQQLIKDITSPLNTLNGAIKSAKTPAAVQQGILTYVSPLNTSLKKLYGFAPPPLSLKKLEANASSETRLKKYINKYFSRWTEPFTKEINDLVSRSPDLGSADTALKFVEDTLVPSLPLLTGLKSADVTYIAGLDLNSKALNFINNDNNTNLKSSFVNLINLAKKLPQSNKADKETKQKFDSTLTEAAKALYDAVVEVIDKFNATIASQSTKLKSLATDRKKGSALYYLKETKNTGKDSTPPENTIKAFENFLKALKKERVTKKELRKGADFETKYALTCQIRALMTTLNKSKRMFKKIKHN